MEKFQLPSLESRETKGKEGLTDTGANPQFLLLCDYEEYWVFSSSA